MWIADFVDRSGDIPAYIEALDKSTETNYQDWIVTQ
jgi:hypothetical protein